MVGHVSVNSVEISRNLEFNEQTGAALYPLSLNFGNDEFTREATPSPPSIVYTSCSSEQTLPTQFHKDVLINRLKPEFGVGDIVWAKWSKNFPVWPAMVVDPMQPTPAMVHNSYVRGAICVMLFGSFRHRNESKYVWVKKGMLFPFVDCLERFKGQMQLYESKPSDLRLAMEEAFLVDMGFFEALEGSVSAIEQHAYQSSHRGIQKAASSINNEDCRTETQWENKSVLHCRSCGSILPSKNANNLYAAKLSVSLAHSSETEYAIFMGPQVQFCLVLRSTLQLLIIFKINVTEATGHPRLLVNDKWNLQNNLLSTSVTPHARFPMHADKHPSSFLGSLRNSLFLFLPGSSLHLSIFKNLLPLVATEIEWIL